MGRPLFKPADEQQRLTVRVKAACGMPHDQIAAQIINPSTRKPISRNTLRLAFKDELAEGSTTANALVAQSLFKTATGKGPGSVTAAIFWLKCRAGWKEATSDTSDEDSNNNQTHGFIVEPYPEV